jgi:predicted membrane metal-binding protein
LKGLVIMRLTESIFILLAATWTFFRATSWMYWKKSAQLERLFEALEIGVVQAWEQVVKPWLEKNGKDQPLPEYVRTQAERVAVAAALKTDKILTKFSSDIIRATLKMAVEEAKRRGGK